MFVVRDSFKNTPGERVVRERWIHTPQYALAVNVQMFVPMGEEEPCVGPAFVAFSREVHRRAAAGNAAWLARHGRVYALVESVA